MKVDKKAIKITKQEHVRVRAALAEKYARRHSEGQRLPELDYVFLGEQGKLNAAYMYVVRNYDFGSFEVVGKLSTDSKHSENARRGIDEFNRRTGIQNERVADAGRFDNGDMRSDTEIGREESGAAGLDREISEPERAGSAVDVAGDIGRTGRRGRDGERGRDAALKTDRNIQADAPAVSAGQAGDGSSQPVDATGAARVMLERAFPQDEQTSVQGQMADGQGVAQNTAAPVVDGQPVYSDIALADYMAKQAAQQKFGDATRSGAEIQHTGMIEAEVQPELEHTTIVTPEENVVEFEQNDGTIETDQKLDSEFVQNQDIFEDTLKNLDDNILDIMEREGGHTLERHVARDEQYLVTRAQGLKGQGATTYYNKQIAIKATQNSIAQHAKEIVEWLRESTTNRLIIMTEHSFHVGYGVQKGETKRIEPLNKTRMVIERSNNKFGFRIITTYPLLK